MKWKFLKVSSISKVIFPSRALFASNCVWLRTLLYQLPRLFCLPPTLSYLNGHSLHIMKPFLVSDFFISRLMPYSCKDATRTECIITWITWYSNSITISWKFILIFWKNRKQFLVLFDQLISFCIKILDNRIFHISHHFQMGIK